MSANEILDTLSIVMDALSVVLSAVARAALANTSAAEWTLATALAGTAWMLSSGRGWRVAGVLVFLATVAAGAWLNWKVGRHGALAQQAVMAAMILHSLKSWGWALAGKGGAK